MPTPDSHLVDQAIQWMIKLRYNTADDASTAAFEQWLQTSEAHQQAWQRVATLNDDFNHLPAHVSRHALDGARRHISRREGLKMLGLFAGAAGLAWLGRDYTPLPALEPFVEKRDSNLPCAATVSGPPCFYLFSTRLCSGLPLCTRGFTFLLLLLKMTEAICFFFLLACRGEGGCLETSQNEH